MIPARKRRWLRWLFRRHARARVFDTFGAIRLHGAEHLRVAAQSGPVLAVANHTSWWDGMMLIMLSEHLVPTDAYVMMDAANLRRLPFFAGLGAFGVDLSSRRDGAVAVRYAAELLSQPGRVVWVFPQGEERPVHERPLRFSPGAARIASLANARTVPVALSYVFGTREQPDVFISIGAPLSEADRDAQAEAVQAELERIERELSNPGSEAFETIGRGGRSSIGWAEKALALLTPLRSPRSLPPAR